MRPNRPILDGSTLVTYAQLSVVALFIVGFGPIQALLREDQGTSRAISGLHASALAAAGIVAAVITPVLVERWGRSVVISLAAGTFSVGAVLFTLPLGPVWTISSVALTSMATASMLINCSAFLLDHQGPAGPASVTQANALAAASGILAPFLVGLSTALIFGWRSAVWLMALLMVFIELLRWNVRASFVTKYQKHRPNSPWKSFPKSMWFSVLLVAIFNSVELTTILWSVDLLTTRGGLSMTAAVAAVSAIPIGVLVGRVFGSRLAETRSVELLLRLGLATALVGFSLAWLGTGAIGITLGLFVVGIGISLNWPLGLSRVVMASGGRATQATSLASLAGGIALLTVPLSLGLMADQIGIHLAFLLLPFLLVIALLILVFGPRPTSASVI